MVLARRPGNGKLSSSVEACTPLATHPVRAVPGLDPGGERLRVSARPDFGAVTPVDDDELVDFFGTTRPTMADIEANDEVLEEVERGHGISIIAYDGGEPSHIYFFGYSYG